MDNFSSMEDTKTYSASTSTVTPLLTKPKGVKNFPAKALDSFRSGPARDVAPALGKNGRVFNAKAAALNTANTPLVKRLKGRHLQMIAIGGSIGKNHQFWKGAISIADNLRHWIVYWLRAVVSHWWSCVAPTCIYFNWSSPILCCSGSWGDGGYFPSSRLLLRLCYSLH